MPQELVDEKSHLCSSAEGDSQPPVTMKTWLNSSAVLKNMVICYDLHFSLYVFGIKPYPNTPHFLVPQGRNQSMFAWFSQYFQRPDEVGLKRMTQTGD